MWLPNSGKDIIQEHVLIIAYLKTPWSIACLCISSLALSSSSSLRNCSIFLASASAFCSAFQTFSTFRNVWGCQLFFKFFTKSLKYWLVDYLNLKENILLAFEALNSNQREKTHQISTSHVEQLSTTPKNFSDDREDTSGIGQRQQDETCAWHAHRKACN